MGFARFKTESTPALLKIRRYSGWLFLFFSVIIIYVGNQFYINDVIPSPQFKNFDEITGVLEQIKSNRLRYYWAFFFIDLIWAPLGLTWLGTFFYSFQNKIIEIKNLTKGGKEVNLLQTFVWLGIGVAILAYTADIIENICYLKLLKNQSALLVSLLRIDIIIKEFFYAVFIILWFYAFYRAFIEPNLKEIGVFIRSAWLSLISVIILVVILTKMDQGGTIVVHLFEEPLNYLLFVVLFNAFALILSHYPTYFEMYRKYAGDDQSITWKLNNPQLWGIGIITYVLKEKHTVKTVVQIFRRSLGLFLYLSWIYVLLYTFQLYVNPRFAPMGVTLAIGAIAIYFFNYLSNLKDGIKKKLREDADPVLTRPWSNLIVALHILIGISIGMTLLTLGAVYYVGWNKLSFFLALGSNLIYISTFILFRVLRSILKYKYHGVLPGQQNPGIKSRWAFLSTNEKYLLLMWLGGWLSLAVFIFSNIFVTAFTPINILLAFLYIFTGVVAIPIKHHMLYRQNEPLRTMYPYNNTLFVHITPIAFIIFIGWTIVSGTLGNELHRLPYAKAEEAQLSMDQYETILLEQMKDKETVYFIGAYGGGLKANIWNQLVLDTLLNFNGENILDATVALSGVSGGSLGQSFYLSVIDRQPEHRKKIIRDLGTANFLSVDVAYLLGWDFVRELLPRIKFKHPDRAMKAMKMYANHLDDEQILKLSFPTYWNLVRLKRSSQYLPVLISNTVGTHKKRGLSCSVFLDDFNSAFPFTENIPFNLNSDRVLTFAAAISCSNRFPVASPAAKVPGKGHFVDGGYFENSGFLSLLDFYDYLINREKLRPLFEQKQIVFIQINNSESAYAKTIVEESLRGKKESESAEFQAILGTVSSISTLPWYIENKVRQWSGRKDSIEFVSIQLPYLLQFADIRSLIKGYPDNALEIEDILIENNYNIKKWLEESHYNKKHWGYIEPPTARVMTSAPVDYMQSMLKEGNVLEDLEEQLNN